MNKTKIEYVDSTWNPVTGCFGTCPYCYARKMANRFSMKAWKCDNCVVAPGCNETIANNVCSGTNIYIPSEKIHDLDFPERTFYPKKKIEPYPYGFEPTFHKYRLNDYKNKKPQNIFVCSMADLFGEWVPDKWIDDVLTACYRSPQHNYLFLTKNPKRYSEALPYWKTYYDMAINLWLGTTLTSNNKHNRAWSLLNNTNKFMNKFLSIEPILGDVNLDEYELLLKGYKDKATIGNYIDWVIVGAETGNQRGKVVPKREWIENIVTSCNRANVPVFMKDSLVQIIGEENMLREFPQGLQRVGNNE
jgi:protein gp37